MRPLLLVSNEEEIFFIATMPGNFFGVETAVSTMPENFFGVETAAATMPENFFGVAQGAGEHG